MITVLYDFKVFEKCVWLKLKATGPPALKRTVGQ